MPTTQSLAVRAGLAIALMVGFYTLALTVSAVLLFIPYAEFVYAHRLTARLAILCIGGAGVILWSIIPRLDRFVPLGPALEPAEQPRLFAQLGEVAKAVGEQRPAEVYLVPELNAWVVQRGGIMGIASRRVMGLGLPLLQIVTASQLRAVLAHEFGHFHGGDTKLGPWIYKTRAAIQRTLQNLARQKSVVMYLFLWYGKVFLRITHAISRRQELSADALASRAVGPRPLISGLKAIHGGAKAVDAYWDTEAGPVLGAGFRPPLAEGFGRFVAVPAIAQAITQALDTELAEAKSDPYDTHPPLSERIAAAERLPMGQAPAEDPPAISLLENVADLEARLLQVAAGRLAVQSLKPVRWEEVGTRVFVPLWEVIVRERASALAGLTAATLPEACKALDGLGSKIPDPPGKLLSREQRAARAVSVLGAALGYALHRRGWVLHALPGEFYLDCGAARVEPFKVVQDLASGELQGEKWREECAAAALSDLSLGEVPPGETVA